MLAGINRSLSWNQSRATSREQLLRSAVMMVEVNVKFQAFQLPLKNPALKQSVPLCYVINLCLKGNVKHNLHLLRDESCMRLLTINHFNFIAANQVLRKMKDVFRGVSYEHPSISATVKLCYTFGLKWRSFLPPIVWIHYKKLPIQE